MTTCVFIENNPEPIFWLKKQVILSNKKWYGLIGLNESDPGI